MKNANFKNDQLEIKIYDLISYFKENKSQMKIQHESSYNELIYFFSNGANNLKFDENQKKIYLNSAAGMQMLCLERTKKLRLTTKLTA